MKLEETSTGVSIVIPVLNELQFTRRCIESLKATVPDDTEIIVIDNGSSDGTAEYLNGCSNISVITNRENRGCAAAWNQGVAASRGRWIVILNNDTVLSPDWLDGLLDFARERGVDIVSPAFREGEYNYDIQEHSREFVRRMRSVSRMGLAQGICFMVRRDVFERVGLFDENFRVGQFEDRDFFLRAATAGFTLGTTGRAFIHHFGSVTQNMIRKNKDEKVKPYGEENRVYYLRKHGLTVWRRIVRRRRAKLKDLFWRISERTQYGHTLIEKLIHGRLKYF